MKNLLLASLCVCLAACKPAAVEHPPLVHDFVAQAAPQSTPSPAPTVEKNAPLPIFLTNPNLVAEVSPTDPLESDLNTSLFAFDPAAVEKANQSLARAVVEDPTGRVSDRLRQLVAQFQISGRYVGEVQTRGQKLEGLIDSQTEVSPHRLVRDATMIIALSAGFAAALQMREASVVRRFAAEKGLIEGTPLYHLEGTKAFTAKTARDHEQIVSILDRSKVPLEVLGQLQLRAKRGLLESLVPKDSVFHPTASASLEVALLDRTRLQNLGAYKVIAIKLKRLPGEGPDLEFLSQPLSEDSANKIFSALLKPADVPEEEVVGKKFRAFRTDETEIVESPDFLADDAQKAIAKDEAFPRYEKVKGLAENIPEVWREVGGRKFARYFLYGSIPATIIVEGVRLEP